jgi:uncharacterized protein YndB with AHSA1/START domain
MKAVKQLTINTRIDAPLEQVWQYYTLPEHITQWNFASPDWHCPSATNDLRAGGSFTSRMEARDGSFGFDFSGIYDEVIAHKRIAYTMEDGRKAITDFKATEGGTEITTVFDAEQQHPEEMQQQGWQAILNQLKTYSEAQAK